MLEYSPEQLWKLYEKLPEDLKSAVFAVDTADDIDQVCTKYEISGDKISEVAKYIGYVLLGVLPPDDFQTVLEKDIGIETEVAKKINHDINRFVFWPVKESLATLYKTTITSPEKAPETTPTKEPLKKGGVKRKDIYRESIE